MTSPSRSGRAALLYLLLVTDFVFIGLYALYGFRILSDPKFGLIEDWSYGEVFQYIKELWIVLLLASLAVRRRSALCGAWCVLFVYLLLDDSLQIHERGGEILAAALGLSPRFGLRAVDFGELLVSGLAGTLFLGVIAGTVWTGSRTAKRFSARLVALLFVLIFFGVVVDMIPITEPWLLGKALGALEDGGEQITMSVILWVVFLNATQEKPSETVRVAESKRMTSLSHPAVPRRSNGAATSLN